MSTKLAALTAQEYSRRFSQEVKRPLLEAAMLGLFPAVAVVLLSHWFNASNWRTSIVIAVCSYGTFFVLYCLWQLTKFNLLVSQERSLELERLRAFEAQAKVSPLYIGPRNYSIDMNGKRFSVGLVIVRRVQVRLTHLKITISGKHGEIFSQDSVDPAKIRDSGDIVFDKLLQQEEFDRIGDTDIFVVAVYATVEGEDVFRNFSFNSIPLRR